MTNTITRLLELLDSKHRTHRMDNELWEALPALLGAVQAADELWEATRNYGEWFEKSKTGKCTWAIVAAAARDKEAALIAYDAARKRLEGEEDGNMP